MNFQSSFFRLIFKRPSGTSRGVLSDKESVLLTIFSDAQLLGIGECSVIKDLNPESIDDIFWAIKKLQNGEAIDKLLDHQPATRFGLECLAKSKRAQDPFLLFPSEFTDGTKGIPINGLIWMGTKAYMFDQIKEKIAQGYQCIKMKIGAIDFDSETALLKYIRTHFSANEIELRVDANGAFDPLNALEKLKLLSEFDIHSIEQPIKPGQWDIMADLCHRSPVDIALDEELIGITSSASRCDLLDQIKPQYIILKPSLLGGWKASEDWISLAEERHIGWWATSALESNIGLNAISQWVANMATSLPQGLGTGQLYTNNINSPLEIREAHLYYCPEKQWDLKRIYEINQ